MSVPSRIERLQGEYSLVDTIPFQLPVVSSEASALIAVFPVDFERAARLLPGKEVHPLRLWSKALLVVTVLDYRKTSIGSYIEYSIAIACTHSKKPAPPLVPALFSEYYDVGQYVIDLPVSTEISVKGGKGIWGMPKHRASLNFDVGKDKVSAQYDLDGELATYVEIDHPGKAWFPAQMGAANFCAFRGMLMKSLIYFRGKTAFKLFGSARARFVVGDHPRVAPLKALGATEPLFTAFIPLCSGTLDDHLEAWFLTEPSAPVVPMEGMESVVELGLGREWPPPPRAPLPGSSDARASGVRAASAASAASGRTETSFSVTTGSTAPGATKAASKRESA